MLHVFGLEVVVDVSVHPRYNFSFCFESMVCAEFLPPAPTGFLAPALTLELRHRAFIDCCEALFLSNLIPEAMQEHDHTFILRWVASAESF